MKRIISLLTLSLISAAPAYSQVKADFTQGSMQSTTTTTVDIDRTVSIETLGGTYKSWSGTNVTPSGDILDAATTYSVTTAGEQFQLETVNRSAGVIETQLIEEQITQNSVTTSLSVFSQ